MYQWIGTVFATLLALGGLCSPSISWGKPPDLPGGIDQQCPEGRERQQGDGFGQRPETPEPPTASSREAGEEQEAPPATQQIRVPTERRRGVNVQPERTRERQRPTSEDVRHREMLRVTQPLETQPQRPMEEFEVVQEEEFEAVQ